MQQQSVCRLWLVSQSAVTVPCHACSPSAEVPDTNTRTGEMPMGNLLPARLDVISRRAYVEVIRLRTNEEPTGHNLATGLRCPRFPELPDDFVLSGPVDREMKETVLVLDEQGGEKR